MKSVSERVPGRLRRFALASALAAACAEPGARAPDAGVQARALNAPTSHAAHGGDAGPPCASCHAADYMAADHPLHPGEKPLACQVCHLDTRWHKAEIHHEFYPLTGAHEQAECADCHGAFPGRYAHTDTACVSCHRKDYDAVGFAAHATFPLTCEGCHDTAAFKPAKHPPAQEPPHEPAHEPAQAGSAEPAATTDAAPPAAPKKKKKRPRKPTPTAPAQPSEPSWSPDSTSGASRHR